MNPEYKKIGIEPLNIWMRYEIGRVLKLDEIDKTADTAAKMLAASDTYKDSIDRFVKEYVYNLGSSASVGAKYIIQEIQKAIKRHKEQEQSRIIGGDYAGNYFSSRNGKAFKRTYPE